MLPSRKQPLSLGRQALSVGRGSATLGAGVRVPAWVLSNLFDADYENARFRFDGISYADETVFNTAIGASKSGIARTIGPYADTTNIMVNGDIADLTGWTNQNSGLGSAVGGELSMDCNGGTNPTVYHAVATQLSHAYRWTATYRRGTSASSVSTIAMNAALTSLGTTPNNSTTSNVTNSRTFGAEGTTSNIGIRSPNAGATGTAIADNFLVYECWPFFNFTAAALAAQISFNTPASVASDQVLFEANGADSTSARNRVTVTLQSADNHLVVSVIFGNAAAATLDLGAVSLGAAHDLEISNATNRFMARIDGGSIVGDITGTIPGVGVIYVGRGQNGNTWTGTIERVTIYDGEYAPDNAISLEGDSYASVTGSGGVSGQALLATSTARPVFSTGVGGDTLATQVARVQANPGLYRGVFVHIDGDANGYTDVATTMANYAAMITALGHGRYIIVPPLRRSNNDADENTAITSIQSQLAALYGATHIVDGQEVLAGNATSPGDDADVAANYVPTSLLQGDGTHLTSTGMDYLTDAIASLITSNGW